ncbi:proteasome subunit beta [Tessaracoccus sp. ZS01]|uniref:proteasome subunit beta n=1 Tax=Tessaracoccus sp. ZS01 TaxID=1906324 RepID=UPI00096D1A4E|nr:proteasome subunit beta [Tessaracoccus sp. ZS01]MCG6566526.1 proteasome subunit beta [Tessaracoccus sp. ZS01]OMG58962.1 proteasome subunit beta [Tessaracoccus sp. ZS01]
MMDSPSFMEYLRQVAPETLPAAGGAAMPAVHGTTIVAARYRDGVVMAGDRRATMGTAIAMRDIEKVFGADDLSIIGVAGVAGLAVELVRLFQVELEHFEKVEGTQLSFDGKANRLSSMLRANLPQAMQGMVVLPLFVGWDERAMRGRMFSYDATGGRYEEHQYCSVGSGAAFARGALKKLHDPDADEHSAVAALLQSLYDAADDDSATSGLDLTRGIFPLVLRASAAGVARWSEEGVRELAHTIVAARTARPDGPRGYAL